MSPINSYSFVLRSLLTKMFPCFIKIKNHVMLTKTKSACLYLYLGTTKICFSHLVSNNVRK